MDPVQITNLSVVGGYLVAVLAVGIYLSRYVKGDVDFFLAGRSLNKWVIAGTVMATNVAAIYLVGPAGAAYGGGGVSVLLIAWTGNMIAAVSALFFVPRFRRLGITTISEFLEERYGLWVRLLVTFLWIVYYSLFAGNAMYAFAVSLQPVLKLDVNTIIWCVSGAVVAYCFLAGLLAVAYTDVIQSFLILLGGLILLPLSMKAVGGIGGFVERVPQVGGDYFVFWKVGSVWPTYKDVIMFTLLGLPYWCTSQYMLQRSFAGRSVRDASKGLALAAAMTGVLTLSYILPGICAAVLYPPGTAGAIGKGDAVLSTMFVRVLPIGLGAMFIAGLVAASNSTASSLLNSQATLAEHDVYRRFRPGLSARNYTWFGRFATLAGGALGLLYAFNVERLGGIIQANYEIMSFEVPIFVIVTAALFWRGANVLGAAAAFVVGVAFNLATAFGPKWETADRTMWSFPICIAALVAVSYLTPQWGRRSQDRIAALFDRMRGPRPDWRSPRLWLGAMVAAVSLIAFVGCAVIESVLPKPGNILIFLGLMTAFVLGCYAMIPALVRDEVEGKAKAEAEAVHAVHRSWVNRVFGSGWSWLILWLGAVALMAILYFVP